VYGLIFKGKKTQVLQGLRFLTREREKRRNFPEAKMDWLFEKQPD
jgi:hypothetical protein